MKRRAGKPPRLTLTFHAETRVDYAALAPDEQLTTRSVLVDLAHGSVTGKALGARHVSGDLTGLFRVHFDVPGRRPRRLRLVYRLTGPSTAEVFAIGRRDDHAVYRLAADRLTREG